MTRLALRNPLAVLMLCVVLLVFAGSVVPRMSVDTFPELAPPVLVVGTLAPGLGPKDVEKTISWRFEKFVSAAPGVDHVTSESRNGLSILWVRLRWGTDLNAAQTVVQQQVDFAMSSVPKSLGVLPPFVLQHDVSNAPLVQIAVYGGELSEPELYDFAVNTVEPVIEAIPGVASAAPNGGRERRINVLVDPLEAKARGITARDVAQAVATTNELLPSGRLMGTGFEANVYTNAVAAKPSEIGQAVVKAHPEQVLVSDVARVEDGGTPPSQAVSIGGRSAVYLSVLRVPGGNTIQIVDEVKKRVAALENLPRGVSVQPIFDQSIFVRNSMRALTSEIIHALGLISLIILVFLQSPRSVLVAAISVPLSFAAILLALYATGQTLNAFTIGGLTLAMGPLVDVSVVVIEAIHRRRQAGDSPAAAARNGAASVAAPMLAATLCMLAVLLPIAFLTGLARKLFGPLAITVGVAMVTAYLVSMLVTPVACRYFLGHRPPGRFARWVEGRIDALVAAYVAALRVVVGHRFVVIVGAALLAGVSLQVASRMPSSFFPEIDESMERVSFRVAPGTSLEQSRRLASAAAKALEEELPQGAAELVLTNVGSPSKARSKMNSANLGPHMGFVRVALAPPEERQLSQREIADRMREILGRRFPGVEFLQAPGGLATSVFLDGFAAPLVVRLYGDDLEVLDRQSRAVAEVARGVAGIRDVRTTLELEYPEVRIETNRAQAGLVGVSAGEVARTALEATLGNINTPGVWVDGNNGQSYYVITSYDRQHVSDVARLGEVPLRAGASGGGVTVASYASIARHAGPVAIERARMQRAAHVLMQTEGRDLGSAAAELEERLRSDPRTRGTSFDFVGQVQLMRETFSGLGLALGLAVLVVFTVMTAQFRSLRLPLTVLFTLPVALVGVLAALLSAGQGLSIPALMGVLMVIGIAVANGILLVDQANRNVADGMEPVEAAVRAAGRRFVPIAMTSLATVAGLLPTALALEHGTEANQPLALAVVGGLATSMVLSLFVVPVVFVTLVRQSQPAVASGP